MKPVSGVQEKLLLVMQIREFTQKIVVVWYRSNFCESHAKIVRVGISDVK